MSSAEFTWAIQTWQHCLVLCYGGPAWKGANWYEFSYLAESVRGFKLVVLCMKIEE